MRYYFIFIISLLFACAHKSEKADIIIHNAVIYTLDDNNTIAQAMAIKDGLILETGAEQQILNKYRADKTIDLKKKTVYPGFIDAHCHLLSYGQSLLNVDLYGVNSTYELVNRVKEYYLKNKPAYILGRGWDQTLFTDKKFPDNELLSKEISDIPVLLYRVDGHAALANKKALQSAGINSTTVVEGGEIILNNNLPTGILVDNAIDLVKNILPEPDSNEIDRALLLAEKNCLRAGLTTLDDAGMDEKTLKRIIALQSDNRFKMRMYIMLWATKESLLKYAVLPPFDTLRTHVRAFKFMADGALGSRGACLKHPYSDIHDRKHYGSILNPYYFYLDAAKLLYESGWQMNTHCIGDSANKMIMQIYAQVLKDMNNKRWRIEHAQILDTADFIFFKNYSLIPSVQPTHATSDMRWAEERLGKNRMAGAYAYKSLLKISETIALGTDFPVEDISPIKTFYAAVTRKNEKGEPASGFLPHETLNRLEALKGMTIWAAYANFEEHEKGTLEKGKQADFVVLSNDIMKCEENDILNTYVLYTFINGEQVYSFE